jgi:arginyl-tRNA synthetase
MRVVKKSIEQYAPELIARSTHLTHGMVKLPGAVKMSSRKGNFIRAVDVIDLIKQTLKETYNSDDEKISMGAIKYAFLKNKLGGDIELDVKESVSMTGNSGPYLQYSAVRAKRILEKSNQNAARENCVTADDHETAIIKKLSLYNSVLQDATDSFAPHKLATYLYELAQEFSRFYEHCPVSGSENEAFRLEIVKKFLETITNGLNLLGIEVPEKM